MPSLLLPAILSASLAMAPTAQDSGGGLSILLKAMIVSAADMSEAVTAPGRPDSATALDESRKPAEVLGFLGLKPGMKAADLMTGGGYWAEIMARAIGEKGHVTAFEPQQFYGDTTKTEWEALLARQKGIDLAVYPFEHFAAKPGSFDFAITNLSYHDLYNQSEKFKIGPTDPAAFVKTLYNAMKPGGVVGVIDHVGLPGDMKMTTGTLHRIDPAVVKADFEKAGFVLEGSSDMLANPDDDHSKNVFDPSIRGKTDRFLMKFRKPR